MARRRGKIIPGSLLDGPFIVETYRGKLLYTPVKRPRKKKKASPAQQKRRDKFHEAVQYARMVIEDPKLKAAYKRKLKGHRSVFQAVLSEYMKKD